MSANNGESGSITPDYDNPEAKQQLDELREQQLQEEREQQIEEHQENETARRAVASEEPPDREPGEIDLRRTNTVEFRGYPFEFYELGDATVEAIGFDQADDDVEEGSRAAEFAYEMLGEKCKGGPDNVRGDPTTEEWWRQFDVGDVIEVFGELVESEVDIDDPEMREKVEEFRGE